MKKMRLHIYITLGLFLTTFVLGSFLDQQLSQALYSKNNTFGLIVSVIGTLPGYSCLAFCGGGLFGLAFTRKYKTVAKVLLYIGAVMGFGLGVFFAGREFFGPNGFTGVAPKWVGYFIALPFMCGAGYLGYLAAKRSDSKILLCVILVLLIAIFMSLVPGVTLLKSIFHRPRYRALMEYAADNRMVFHQWWQRCTNYEAILSDHALLNDGLIKEEFKSFPSGHAGASLVVSLVLAFAPMFDERIKKNHLVYFYAGLAWTILVAFSRILVGAHFLSDVSMGAMLTTIFMLIANEVIIFGKNKYEKKKQLAESKEE